MTLCPLPSRTNQPFAAARPLDSRSDAELHDAWRRGDQDAGQRLFARYYVQIRRFFQSKLGDTRVDDLVQDTFAACVAGRERLQDRSNFRGYMLGVAKNVLYRHLRRRYRDATRDPADDVELLDPTPLASAVLSDREELLLLLQGLHALPPKYRAVLELYYWEQRSTPEVAELLDVPLSTVRSRLCRAREALDAAMSATSRLPMSRRPEPAMPTFC